MMNKIAAAFLTAVFVVVCLLSTAASAAGAPDFSQMSDKEVQEIYEAVRDEMIARGLPLAQEITLKSGKFIVGEDILPGTYTVKCLKSDGDTYGDLYSGLGNAYSGIDSSLGGLMGSLGGMMGDLITTGVDIIGDYGTVLKSYELKTGDSVTVKLEEGTALQISDGSVLLVAG